jgi:hypothetical protein
MECRLVSIFLYLSLSERGRTASAAVAPGGPAERNSPVTSCYLVPPFIPPLPYERARRVSRASLLSLYGGKPPNPRPRYARMSFCVRLG